MTRNANNLHILGKFVRKSRVRQMVKMHYAISCSATLASSSTLRKDSDSKSGPFLGAHIGVIFNAILMESLSLCNPRGLFLGATFSLTLILCSSINELISRYLIELIAGYFGFAVPPPLILEVIFNGVWI